MSLEKSYGGLKKFYSLIIGLIRVLIYRSFLELATKAIRLYQRDGLCGLILALKKISRYEIAYSKWIKKYDTLSESDILSIGEHIKTFSYMPLISVIMPVYNPPEKYLRLAIESVKKQIYSNWELCIADDASTLPHVVAVLNEAQQSDSRIKVIYRSNNGHISAASNSALEIATGEFIAFLDHDDEFAKHALYMVTVALNDRPSLNLIYSDYDKINTQGRRFDPYFKPDWNPDLLYGQNMICHLNVYRTSVVKNLGGLRVGFEGSQDWDLALRVTDSIKPEEIYHIPYILYHWRTLPGSTSLGIGEKRYAATSAYNALLEHWQRKGVAVSINEVQGGGHFRTSIQLPEDYPLISIIIPTYNGLDLLKTCLEGLFSNTNYPAKEIIVVDNRSNDPATLEYLDELEAANRIRLLRYDASFNFSAINNMAVTYAKGELICLLNNDIAPISSDWLNEMASHALRPEIGVVGAMLYYPDNSIQHAGVLLGAGEVAGHLYQGSPKGEVGAMNRACLIQNLSAVTGACMVVRKQIWEEVGGMDQVNLKVKFNDVDFCLKVQQCGYRNLWTPYAELYHHESASLGRDDSLKKLAEYNEEVEFIKGRWGPMLDNDLAWNPNLILNGAWPIRAHSPRLKKPWLES